MSATPKSTATQVTSLPTSTDTIPKPEGLSIDRFRSKRSLLAGNVETLLPPLSHSKIGDTGDYVRLHHDEDRYWSGELCFVTVPPAAKQKKGDLHLIEEDLAVQNLPSKAITRQRIALATKPNGRFFLCLVPSQNLDNIWNATARDGCIEARTRWVWVTSRAAENVEGYAMIFPKAQTAFAEIEWPKQTLSELIEAAFKGRMIVDTEHPGFLRLIGAEQKP